MPDTSVRTGHSVAGGKKTADAIQKEVTREVEQLLRVLFQDRRKTERLDMEAIEMAMRSAVRRAGAAALSQLLQFPEPDCRSAHSALLLRPAGRLQGTALQADPHGAREGGSLASLLLLPTLP